MIGAFARKLGTKDRVLSYEETGEHKYALKTRSDAGEDKQAETHDAPPEGFVERIPHEGGDVFLAPVLETLRSVLRGRLPKRSVEEEASASTLPRVHEND
jgi:hypothetical protein